MQNLHAPGGIPDNLRIVRSLEDWPCTSEVPRARSWRLDCCEPSGRVVRRLGAVDPSGGTQPSTTRWWCRRCSSPLAQVASLPTTRDQGTSTASKECAAGLTRCAGTQVGICRHEPGRYPPYTGVDHCGAYAHVRDDPLRNVDRQPSRAPGSLRGGGQPSSATVVRSCSRAARASSPNSCWLSAATHLAYASLNASAPSSAARLATESGTPRARSAPAIAAV